MLHYILVNRVPVPVSLMDWADWFEANHDRTVGRTNVGDTLVSTVFVGFDYAKGASDPLVFQTVVFGGPLDTDTTYTPNWDDAEKAHAAMVKRVQEAQA